MHLFACKFVLCSVLFHTWGNEEIVFLKKQTLKNICSRFIEHFPVLLHFSMDLVGCLFLGKGSNNLSRGSTWWSLIFWIDSSDGMTRMYSYPSLYPVAFFSPPLNRQAYSFLATQERCWRCTRRIYVFIVSHLLNEPSSQVALCVLLERPGAVGSLRVLSRSHKAQGGMFFGFSSQEALWRQIWLRGGIMDPRFIKQDSWLSRFPGLKLLNNLKYFSFITVDSFGFAIRNVYSLFISSW